MDQITLSGYFRRPAHLVAQQKGLFAAEGLEVGFHLVGLECFRVKLNHLTGMIFPQG